MFVCSFVGLIGEMFGGLLVCWFDVVLVIVWLLVCWFVFSVVCSFLRLFVLFAC